MLLDLATGFPQFLHEFITMVFRVDQLYKNKAQILVNNYQFFLIFYSFPEVFQFLLTQPGYIEGVIFPAYQYDAVIGTRPLLFNNLYQHYIILSMLGKLSLYYKM